MERLDDQLQKEVDLLSTYLSHAQGNRNIEMIIGRYEAVMKRIKFIKGSYLIELSSIKDRNERHDFEIKLEKQTKRIEEMSGKIEKIIQLRQKKLLTTLPIKTSDIELQGTEDQLYLETKSIQNKTKYSLIRTNDMIEHSSVVATSTLETLQSQREQIKGIGNTVVNLELNATQSGKLLKEYARIIASDRIFQFFTVLNILLIALIILYLIVSHSK